MGPHTFCLCVCVRCSNFTCSSLLVSLVCLAFDILGNIFHVPPYDSSEEGSADVNILILQIKIQGASQRISDSREYMVKIRPDPQSSDHPLWTFPPGIHHTKFC